MREHTTVHEAGGRFDFDASDIHGVRHPGTDAPPATSIHFYSPALWRMGHYEPGPARDAPRRHDVRGRAPRRRLSRSAYSSAYESDSQHTAETRKESP